MTISQGRFIGDKASPALKVIYNPSKINAVQVAPAEERDPDLICFSHLRWNFVFQRPQHILTHFSTTQRVFFIEEPIFADGVANTLLLERKSANLLIITPQIRLGLGEEALNNTLQNLLSEFFAKEKIGGRYIFWYYTPMALEFTRNFNPTATVYDCMDELSAFDQASSKLLNLEKELFNKADVVFTGGHSLYEAKKLFHSNAHPMPSSIDKAHFAKARLSPEDPDDQRKIPGPRFGFFGVIDERFDLSLLQFLAEARPHWQFVILGPVVKIDPSTLPKLTNIHYLGSKSYEDLPSYLGNWDVAIMPFALNKATKYISPTKTPEFLAGGIPVVSTAITDVVTPYEKQQLVSIGRTSEEFLNHCDAALDLIERAEWLVKVDAFLQAMSWNRTCSTMKKLVTLAEHHLSVPENTVRPSFSAKQITLR